ncbi:hypothetical protein MRX96_007072 [Rhipicephalus microplus]
MHADERAKPSSPDSACRSLRRSFLGRHADAPEKCSLARLDPPNIWFSLKRKSARSGRRTFISERSSDERTDRARPQPGAGRQTLMYPSHVGPPPPTICHPSSRPRRRRTKETLEERLPRPS